MTENRDASEQRALSHKYVW